MNGETFILYTTEIGGKFNIIKGTRADYDEMVRVEYVWAKGLRPALLALLSVEDNFDVILGCSRDDDSALRAHVSGLRRHELGESAVTGGDAQ